jgi:FkbM family methyltransferase
MIAHCRRRGARAVGTMASNNFRENDQTMAFRMLEKIGRRLFLSGCQGSYSQFGEDLIVSHFFHGQGIVLPSYLDIGANHPRFISNTYYFYQRGSHGVLVEPNPRLSKRLRSARPRDVVLDIGIGADSKSEADFYLFAGHADGLSTFSRAEALHWETVGMKGAGRLTVDAVLKIALIPINEVIRRHFPTRPPHFLSLDIEGLDLDILKTLDFARHGPDMICVETLAYRDDQSTYKRTDTIEFMHANGYGTYADTRVNTIFCRSKLS